MIFLNLTEFRLLLIKITRYLRTNANINIFLGLFPMYHESSITIPINIARHRRKIQNYSRGRKAQKINATMSTLCIFHSLYNVCSPRQTSAPHIDALAQKGDIIIMSHCCVYQETFHIIINSSFHSLLRKSNMLEWFCFGICYKMYNTI